MASALLWFLNVVLGDEFVLMCGMFLCVGLFEYFLPAQKIPRRHYAFNLGYAFLNIFAVITLTPFLSAGAAYGMLRTGSVFAQETPTPAPTQTPIAISSNESAKVRIQYWTILSGPDGDA